MKKRGIELSPCRRCQRAKNCPDDRFCPEWWEWVRWHWPLVCEAVRRANDA